MLTKKDQPKNTPDKKNNYVFSVKIKKYVFSIIARDSGNKSFNGSVIYKLYPLFGELLLLAGGFVLLFSGVYALVVWWRIIPQFDFWGFMGSVILFPLTIPLAPIYLGVKGDWEPTGVFIFTMILGVLLLKIGSKLFKIDLAGISPSR
jgi:hypothetical protein